MSFTVTYSGNGATEGSVPVDSNTYAAGDEVTVLGNTGNLIRPSDTFARWNTKMNGSGIPYGPYAATSFPMPLSNVTLYAQWYTQGGLGNIGLGQGVTQHYVFSYENPLNAGGLEPDRTNSLMRAASNGIEEICTAQNNSATPILSGDSDAISASPTWFGIADSCGFNTMHRPYSLTNGIPVCENDYNIMLDWFGGTITLNPAISVPVPTYMANLSGGAGWGSSLTIKAGSNNADYVRYLMVSEVTEMFMAAQNMGWFAPDGADEQSCGEGLSRFLAQQFLVQTGIGVIEPGYAISPSWLNSSLPTSNPSSTQLGPSLTTLSTAIDNVATSFTVVQAQTIPFASTYIIQIDNEQMLVTAVSTATNVLTVTRGYNGTSVAPHGAETFVYLNYGSRADYVNLTLEYDNGIDAATGCAMLFIYYLHVELGFSINAIIAAAPGVNNAATCLRGVYQNLTNDDGDPFPLFKQLLDDEFPPDQVAVIPGPNPDNPWPLRFHRRHHRHQLRQ